MGGADPCPGQACDENLGQCVDCMEGDACDDGEECTENDTCENGTCVGTAVDCSTTDLCVLSLPCDPAQGCQYDDVCDDGDPCTLDSCCLDSNGLFSDELCPSDQVEVNCYHDPMWPLHDVAVLCPNLGCAGTITVPSPTYVSLNNDDDDGNGIADFLQEGPVLGENDLKPINISFGNCVTEDCEDGAEIWGFSSATGIVRVYFDADKSSIMEGGYPLPAPSPVFMEGWKLSSVCGAPIVGGVGPSLETSEVSR